MVSYASFAWFVLVCMFVCLFFNGVFWCFLCFLSLLFSVWVFFSGVFQEVSGFLCVFSRCCSCVFFWVFSGVGLS